VRQAAVLFATLAVVAAAIAAAGCGGGGKSSGGKPLTKSEFVAKADGICRDAIAKRPTPPSDIANVDPTASSTTDEQLKKFGDFIEKVVKQARQEVDDLRGVKPPANLQGTYDRALATLDEAINELEEAGEAARKADRTKFKDKVAESQRHSDEANKLAKQLGLSVCGQG
jgi:hypothetical protein